MRIVERIINGETDRRIVLENGYISRQLEIGSNWNSLVLGIRSGFLFAKDEIITDNPRFFVGLSAGSGSPFPITGSTLVTSSNIIGAYYGGVSATQLGYSSSSNDSSSFVYAWQPNQCLVFLRKQDGSYQDTILHQIQTPVFGAGSRNGEFLARIPFFINFVRTGSRVYGTISCPMATPWGANQDTTLETFAAAMSGSFSNIPTVFSGMGFQTFTSTPLPVTESTYGYLDSVSIFWNQGAYAAWELSDVAVSIKS